MQLRSGQQGYGERVHCLNRAAEFEDVPTAPGSAHSYEGGTHMWTPARGEPRPVRVAPAVCSCGHGGGDSCLQHGLQRAVDRASR